MTQTSEAGSPHVVTIDAVSRVRAVAWLARYHRHPEARKAIRALALAVGVECRGGRVYPPHGWSNYLAVGWDRFIDRVSYQDSDIRWLMERMADHGARNGATVTLSAELADELRANRDAARARQAT